MNKIFITGGTGFLGSEIIKEIIFTSTDLIYALIRGKTQEIAEERLLSTLLEISDGAINEEIFKERIKVLKGDIASEKLGLDESAINELIENVDIIYNNAAVTELNMPVEEIRKINVYGTRNVLDLAVQCRDKGNLEKVNHISTAYIVGKKKCVFKETDLDIDQDFNNTYEQSKFEAELLVEEYRKNGLLVDNYRPGIILGRYKDGMTTNFKMFYQPMHFFAKGLYTKVPAIIESMPNLINIDITAQAIVRISGLTEKTNMNYHVVSPETTSFRFALSIAADYFGFQLPEFVDPEDFDMEKEYSPVCQYLVRPYLPYFNYRTKFDMSNCLEALEKANFEFPRFDADNFNRIFEYCDKKGFIRRKKDNVVIG